MANQIDLMPLAEDLTALTVKLQQRQLATAQARNEAFSGLLNGKLSERFSVGIIRFFLIITLTCYDKSTQAVYLGNTDDDMMNWGLYEHAVDDYHQEKRGRVQKPVLLQFFLWSGTLRRF